MHQPPAVEEPATGTLTSIAKRAHWHYNTFGREAMKIGIRNQCFAALFRTLGGPGCNVCMDKSI
jgi:hypothetical protein